MAWPTSPQWTVFNEQSYTSFMETISYNFDLFNQFTGGGFLLTSGTISGDFAKEAYFKRISGLVRDRDITSESSVSAVDFTMDETAKVKFAKSTPPVKMPPHFWEWIGQDPEVAAAWYGRQLAEDSLDDVMGAALGAIIGATANVGATATYDGTAGVASLLGLVNTQALWGDRASQRVCWVMHSKSANDLHKEALANSSQLFTFGSTNVLQDSFGKPFVISDRSELVYTSSGTKYHILGLQQGAVVVEGPNNYRSNVETSNGGENIQETIQSQWTWNMALKGYTWDVTNGGRNPNAAARNTGTNWDKKATSVKDIGAIMGNFQ